MHVEVAKYKALLGDLDEDTQRKVMAENIVRILGVEES